MTTPNENAQVGESPRLVDATRGDFYDLGLDFVVGFGFVTQVDKGTGHPFCRPEDVGRIDPRHLRFHDLKKKTPAGAADRRWSIQTVNDPDAEYGPPGAGEAPYQPEDFTARNRSTRVIDGRGRVALPCSIRQNVDAEDGRHVEALRVGALPLDGAEVDTPEEAAGDTGGGDFPIPEGVAFREAGSSGGTGGSVTQTRPSVSINGLTVFGQAAVDAAKNALAQGGTAMDAAAAASAAGRGLKPPPIRGGGEGSAGASAGPTRERPPPPARNPRGAVAPSDRPVGYVYDGERIGLWSTLVAPGGIDPGRFYFPGGAEGPIGRLAWRHDAHVTAGEGRTGAIRFVTNDAAGLARKGKPHKGEMWFDTSLADQDTNVGLEDGKWVPVVFVDPDQIEPPLVPPEGVPSGASLGKDEENGGKEPEEGSGTKNPREGRPPPDPFEPIKGTAGPGPGVALEVDEEEPAPTAETPQDDDDPRDLPIPGEGTQAADLDAPGTPCPNRTGGIAVGESIFDETFDPITGQDVTSGLLDDVEDAGGTRTREPGTVQGADGSTVTDGFPEVVDLPDGGVAIGGSGAPQGITLVGLGAFSALGAGVSIPFYVPPEDQEPRDRQAEKEQEKKAKKGREQRRRERAEKEKKKQENARDRAKFDAEKARLEGDEARARAADRRAARAEKALKDAEASEKARQERAEKRQAWRDRVDKASTEKKQADAAKAAKRAQEAKQNKDTRRVYRDGHWVEEAIPARRESDTAGRGATLRSGAWAIDSASGQVSGGGGFDSDTRAAQLARDAGDL